MSKLLNWFKSNFFTKKFISFGIIGVVNTAVDAIVLYIYYLLLTSNGIHLYIGKTLAFIIATIGSYFLNSFFTFKEDKFTLKGFINMFVVFTIKLIFTLILTFILSEIFKWIVGSNKYDFEAAVLSSFAMIPVTFLVLDKIFTKLNLNNENKINE